METYINMAITIIVAIAGSGGLLAYMQKRADAKDVRRKMLMGLAHDRLLYLSLQYLHRGNVSKEEFENLHKYLYLPYKDLCGNGTIDKIMKDVEKLPIVSSIHYHPIDIFLKRDGD